MKSRRKIITAASHRYILPYGRGHGIDPPSGRGGADVNAISADGKEPLGWPSTTVITKLLRFLIDNKQDLNHADAERFSRPLFWAADRRNIGNQSRYTVDGHHGSHAFDQEASWHPERIERVRRQHPDLARSALNLTPRTTFATGAVRAPHSPPIWSWFDCCCLNGADPTLCPATMKRRSCKLRGMHGSML